MNTTPENTPESSESDEAEGARIAKVMARAGLCSRREAEAWITEGRVKVNGKVIKSPALDIGPSDTVEVDGKPLPQRERTRLFLYHKPAGLVTTNSDPQGRPTIYESLPGEVPRVVSVGRLDIASEGLLLLTNDGGLARALELPETGWVRKYRVRALGTISQARLDKLKDGISIDGVNYGSIDAAIDRTTGANIWITFAIREGKNREVRNVLGALGLAVNRLIRVSFGPFNLGEIPEGAVAEVRTRQLREELGERIIKLAGVDLDSAIVEREPSDVRKKKPDLKRLDYRKPVREDRFDRRPDTRATFAHEAADERKARFEKPQGERPRFEKPRFDKPRDSKFGEDRPRNFNRDEKPGEEAELPSRSPKRPHKSASHVWRSEDKLLRRKFRGNRDDETAPREKFSPNPEAKKKAGLIADRKGRRILVERFGEKKVEPEPEITERPRGRYGKSDDRAPRGERTYGKREDRAPRGDRPYGDRPRGDRPFEKRGDRPFTKREDRPQAERAYGDRPQRSRFKDDKPRGERNFSDKPRGERSYGDKPRGERSFGKPGGFKSGGDRPKGRSFGGPGGKAGGKGTRRDRTKAGPRPSRPKE
jgi:23S rRNA pseudouridine2605 synthase